MNFSTHANKQLTIAFDTWPLSTQFRNTGTHVYARNLLSHFRDIAGVDSVEFRPFVCFATANDANEFQPSSGFRPYETNLLRVGRAWRYGGACFSAFRSKANLLFCPSGTTLGLAPLLPVVNTIHDLIPVFFPTLPKARYLRFEFARAARHSRAVITDSIHSKNDLINILGIDASKVHVVYLACEQRLFNTTPPDPVKRQTLLKRLNLQRPYILSHGRIEHRKNLRRLVEAYHLALTRNPGLEIDLVLVGALGWRHDEILRAGASPGAPGRVIFAGPQSDTDLVALLKSATLAVIPSLYEGFCLPLLEAMACGAPTICSTSSCLPEISGGVLRYFDPYSTEEMADCIGQVLQSSTLRESLSLKGQECARAYSWQRCAQETLAVLKSVAN